MHKYVHIHVHSTCKSGLLYSSVYCNAWCALLDAFTSVEHQMWCSHRIIWYCKRARVCTIVHLSTCICTWALQNTLHFNSNHILVYAVLNKTSMNFNWPCDIHNTWLPVCWNWHHPGLLGMLLPLLDIYYKGRRKDSHTYTYSAMWSCTEGAAQPNKLINMIKKSWISHCLNISVSTIYCIHLHTKTDALYMYSQNP